MKDENNSMWGTEESDVKGIPCADLGESFKCTGICKAKRLEGSEREMRWDSKDSQGPDYAELGGLYLKTCVLY